MSDVETTAEYRKRKREELALLRELCGAPETDWPGDGAALLAEKQRLRARILARAHVDHPGMTESNLSGSTERTLGRARFISTYQRWDGRWIARRYAEEIYPPGDAPWPPAISLGYLTNSGMAAVAATLTALDHLVPDGTRLHVPWRAYFETVRFADRWLHHLRRPPEPVRTAAGDVVLLDSITAEDWPATAAARPLAALAALVFDTTCYDGSSPRISAVVARAAADGVPLILVRSHLKLDCLGTEHGRLGSIIVVLPRRESRPRFAFARALDRALRDVLSLTGAPFAPEHLFPPTADPDLLQRFRRLNRLRNQRLAASNARAVDAVAARAASSGTLIRPYHHQLFFQVDPLVDRPEAVTEYREELLARLRAAGVFTLRAPSFGYDFFGVTQFFYDGTTASKLRIAVPDAPTEEVDRFAEVAGEWAARLDPWYRTR